jgi:hypothetical protein
MIGASGLNDDRPPDKTNEDYLNKVKEEISTIKEKHRRDIFVIGGDFNLPDINWEEQTIINDIWVCRFYDCFEEFSLIPQALEVDVEYSDLFLM